jgi:hypothetical protein
MCITFRFPRVSSTRRGLFCLDRLLATYYISSESCLIGVMDHLIPIEWLWGLTTYMSCNIIFSEHESNNAHNRALVEPAGEL